VRGTRYTGPPMTLGNAAEAKVWLIVWCKECGHKAESDPAGQAAAYGPDMPVPEWGARLRCSHCGGRDTDYVVSGARR
jgi:hypothetical protein